MADDSAQRAGQLKPTVEQITERFATSCGTSGSRREIRDLADDLLLDLIGTLGRASLGEIAQTVEVLERRRKLRPPPAKNILPGALSGAIGRRGVDIRERAGRAVEADVTPGARNPFDITSPSELLDQVTELTQNKLSREEEPPASVTRVRRPEQGERVVPAARAKAASLTATPESVQNAPPKAPAIALREGEQLLRSSGSGVVIRRIRSA